MAGFEFSSTTFTEACTRGDRVDLRSLCGGFQTGEETVTSDNLLVVVCFGEKNKKQLQNIGKHMTRGKLAPTLAFDDGGHERGGNIPNESATRRGKSFVPVFREARIYRRRAHITHPTTTTSPTGSIPYHDYTSGRQRPSLTNASEFPVS